MKRVLLLIVLSTALLTLGFAQAPDTGSNTGTGNPPAANAAPPAATVNPLPQTAISPAVETVAPPPATASPAPETDIPPAAPVNPPPQAAIPPAAETVAAPPATASPAPETSVPPAVGTAAPAATVSPSPETVIRPAAKAAHATARSTHPRRPSGANAASATVPSATVSPSSETTTPLPADAAMPAATADPSSETVSTPAPVNTPQPVVAHKGGSTWLLISVAVLVLILGTLIPAFGRWRKRRILEETEAPNLSFSNETIPEPDTTEPRKAA